MTQTEVATATGLSLPTISGAENGENVNPATAKALIEFLELDPRDVVIEEVDAA